MDVSRVKCLRLSLIAPLVAFVLTCASAIVSAQETAHVVEDGQVLQQTDPQFVWLWRHLNLQVATAKRVCQLNESQQAELAAFDATWLLELLSANDKTRVAKSGGAVVFPRTADGVRIVQAAGRGRPTAEYVRDALALLEAQFQRVLTDEQHAALSKETAAAAAFRAETLAMATVSNIQRRIYLDAERREKLQKEIAKWAATQDELYTLMYARFPQTIPNLPQSLLSTVFSKEEMLQLDTLRKTSLQAIAYESQMFQHETAIIMDESKAKSTTRTGGNL